MSMGFYERDSYFALGDRDIQIEEARNAEYERQQNLHFDQLTDVDEDEG